MRECNQIGHCRCAREHISYCDVTLYEQSLPPSIANNLILLRVYGRATAVRTIHEMSSFMS